MENKYIVPNIRGFNDFVSLEEYANSRYKYFFNEPYLTIDQLLENNRSLILGEPGMGKTRLLKETTLRAIETGSKAIYVDLKSVKDKNLIKHILDAKDSISKDSENTTIFGSNDFQFSKEIEDTKYVLCLDALDEVLPANRSSVLDGVREIIDNYPRTSILCSCRKNYYQIFPMSTFCAFSFVYIDIFKLDQVKCFLEDHEISQEKINSIFELFKFKNRDLMIQTPRYLDMVAKFFKESSAKTDETIISRNKLFENCIYKKLEEEAIKGPQELQQKKELIKRVLEKLALVMEIYQTNIITKDELMSYFDDVDSNISSFILSQIDISLFYERSLLKDNFDGTIQFENTEIQEYLAAKEIGRLGHLEQTVFDLCVEAEMRELYPSWMNTLNFVIELRPRLAVSLLQLSYAKENRMQDEEYHKLVTNVDKSNINLKDRELIFKQILNYYQEKSYLMSLDIAENLGKLYDSSFFMLLINDTDKIKEKYIRQANIARTINYIIENNQKEADYWKKVLLSLDYKDNTFLAKEIIFALGNARDIGSIKVIAGPLLLQDNKNIIDNIISACMRANPNDEFSILSYVEGTKKDNIIARYGFYSVTDKQSLIFILTKLIEDKEFSNKFFEDESIFKDKDATIIANLSKVWDEDLEQKALEFAEVILSDWERYPSQQQCLFKNFLQLAQDKNSSFILSLTENLVSNKGVDSNILPKFLSPLINLPQVNSFIEALSKVEGGLDIAFTVLQEKKFYHDEFSKKIYEEGRKYFEKEYQAAEASQSHHAFLKHKEDSLLDTFRYKLESAQDENISEVFAFYNRNRNELSVTDEDLKKLRELAESILDKFDPGHEIELKIIKKEKNGQTYTTSKYISIFGDCLLLIELLKINVDKYRQKLIDYIPFAYSEHLQTIFNLIENITDEEIERIIYIYTNKRKDDLASFAPNNLINAAVNYRCIRAIPVLQKFVDNQNLELTTRVSALKAIGSIDPSEDYINMIFEKYSIQEKIIELAEASNNILIKKFENRAAIEWRVNELIKRAFEFMHREGAHFVGKQEAEITDKHFASPVMQLSNIIFIDKINELAVAAFDIYDKSSKYHEYARYLWIIAAAFYENLKQTNTYLYLQKFISGIISRFGQHEGINEFSYIFQTVKNNYLNYIGRPANFNDCIKQYNLIKKNQYIKITSSQELLEVVVSTLEKEFRNWVENEGAYKFIQESTRKQEDLIQKTIKTQIENGLLKRGLRNIELRREEQLLDDKRPDMLISYGLIGPILIEIKRVDNKEVYNDSERIKYRDKLLQYMRATDSAYALYLAFQINDGYSLEKYGPKLIDTYREDKNIIVSGFNCIKNVQYENSDRKNIKGPKRKKGARRILAK